jgi:glc operon protein GlcG
MRTVHTIDYSEAKRAVDLIVEKALQMQKAAAIAVADSHGDLVCFARMDGAPVSSIRIAMNKAWTASRERKPTKEIGEKVKHPEKGHDIAYYGDPKYLGWGGGIPVWKNGEVIGAVAVSGLSSIEDVALAELGVGLIAGDDKRPAD